MSSDQPQEQSHEVRVVHTTTVDDVFVPPEWIGAFNHECFEENKAMFGDMVDQCPSCSRTRILRRETGTYLCAVCDSSKLKKDVEN